MRVVDAEDRVVSTNLLPEPAENGLKAAPPCLPAASSAATSPTLPSTCCLCSESQGGGGGRGGDRGDSSGGGVDNNGRLRTQLVLLDFGLAEELTPEVRHHFVSFLNAICSGKLRV